MVARETILTKGLSAVGLPGASPSAVETLLAYEEILAGPGIDLGFVGPAERPRLLERHILDSASLVPHLDPSGGFVDVGSGAGLPGIVLAILTDLPSTLIEAERKRAAFLEETARRLHLAVEVRWGRSEELGRRTKLRESFGTAVCRALAPPSVSLEYLLPFVRVGGRAVIAVGKSALEAREGSEAAATELGGACPDYTEVSIIGETSSRWVMTVQKVAVTDERYPRRTGVPSRRPLGTPQRRFGKVE